MKAIIIGAGIGGLTSAIALSRKNIDFNLFEAAPEIREVGAGIWVAPNGMNVFERLGIAEDVRKEGTLLKEICIVDTKEKIIGFVDGMQIMKKYGNGTTCIHRAVLQQTLLKYVPKEKIFTGKRLLRYEENENGVNVFFEDGSYAEGDILIAADGIHSATREQMFGEIPMRYSKQTCWRIVSDLNLSERYRKKMFEYWGNEKGLRAGLGEVADGKVYLYITYCTDAGGKDDKSSLKNRLHEICKDFPPVIHQVIDAADPGRIVRTDLFDFAPIKKWTKGKAALIGDAAHATTPNLGQGGCQAIESGYVIADCLAKNENIKEAFSLYEDIRMKKAHFITNTSWNYAKLSNVESALGRRLIKVVAKYSPAFIQENQFKKIYSVNF